MDMRQIRKSGGSFFVVIPVKYLKALSLNYGDYVRLELAERTLLIDKIDLPNHLKKGVIAQKETSDERF